MSNKYVGTDIKAVITGIREDLQARGKNLKAVYFVACGGSEASIAAGKYMLATETRTLAVGKYNSNLFVHDTPAMLDDTCIVVCCTLKGTAETIEAMRTAEKAGAYSIALTGKPDTPMALAAPCVVLYGGGGTASNSTSASLKIAMEILHQFENWEKYEKAAAVFDRINGIVEEDKAHWLAAAQTFGREFAKDEIFYVLGCGPLEGTAYSMANCHLIEMQTKHAVLIPSGDYFHGPFESTTKELPLILLESNGKARPLDERVLRFLERFAGRYTVIDAAESALYKASDPAVAEYFEPVVLWPVERMFVEQMAEVRGRSMDDRNYMWKFDY